MHARPLATILLALTAVLASNSLAAQAEPAGGFVTRRGGQDVARERYRFDGRTLRAEVELVTQGLLVETETIVEDRGVPGRYRAQVRAGWGGAPLTEVQATFGDSVRWSMQGGARRQDGVSPFRRPLFVIQNSVFSQLALAIQLYSRRPGGRPALYAWRPDGGLVSPLGVAIAGTEASVQLGGVRMNVELDTNGWMRRLTIPAQNLVVEWRAAVPLPARSLADPADTLAPAEVSEESYRIEGGAGTATLALPAARGPVPVAVIVASSGEVDRDGNALPSIRPNTYAQLAWGLARRGVATLRFELRSGAVLTTFDDLAEDVVSAVRALAADARFSRVVVLGHQAGGWLAVRAAVRGVPVAGIALLGAPGRRWVDLLRYRLSQSADSVRLVQFDSVVARFLRGEPQAGLPLYLEPLLQPAGHRHLASLAAYDVLSELRRVDVPVLLVHGDRDAQVPVTDAEVLRAATTRGEVVVVAGVNHLFKDAGLENRIGALALEMDPQVPIAQAVIERLVVWVNR